MQKVPELLKKINNIKLRNKLMLSFIIAVFVPVMIAGVYLTYELRKMALDDAIQSTSDNVNRIKKQVNAVLKVPINVSNQLLFDGELKKFANTDYQTTWQFVKAYMDYQHFNEYLRLYGALANIRFYMANPTMINNWEIIKPTGPTFNRFWYQKAMDEKGLIGWYYIRDKTKKQQKYVSLVRRIDFLEYHSQGMLVIDVSGAYLNSILSQNQAETVLVDKKNQIVAANRKKLIGKSLQQAGFPQHKVTNFSGTLQGVVNGKASKIIVQSFKPESSYNGFRIVSVFPIQGIVAQANHISFLGFIVISISFAVAFVLIYVFSKFLSNRLSSLSKQIDQVSSGNLDTILAVDGDDEIGRLSREFNYMVNSIKGLMDEIHETNEQKNQLQTKQNEIKLKMMASQIHPHFLFNALESIRMKAHLNGEREISKVVKLLGKLMRKSLEVGGERIPLKNEMERVRCYLEIQKFRYESRLNYDFQIDPLSEGIPIYPLTIQPLVENAVIHGLEDKEEGGTVFIITKVLDSELHIDVIDNGIGINEEKKEEIYRSLQETEERPGSRIGLRNVHQRLQLTYGERYGLTIDSMPHIGTRIHFSIPFGGKWNV